MDDRHRNAPAPSHRSSGIAPEGLPRAPSLFWSMRPGFEELARAEESPPQDVLDRLGSPPFPKTGFPFIGFLATVYDHVVTHTES